MRVALNQVRGVTAGLLVALNACSPKSEGMNASGKIPVTAASVEARQEFLQGQELSDNIRQYDAHQHFVRAIEKDSGFAMAWYNFALTSPTGTEFFDGMRRAVALADQASPGERLTILGLQAGVNGDPAKQRELYQQLVTQYPQDERAHFLLGAALAGAQNYDGAIAEYEKAVAVAPGYAPAYNLLGYAYRSLDKYSEAELAFKRYVELIPSDPNPPDSYAELLLKMGRFDESIAMYRKALALDPHFMSSLVGIANNYIYKGQPDSALAVTGEMTAAARNDAEKRTAIFTTAVIQTDQRKFDLAMKALGEQYALAAAAADTATMAGDHDAMGAVMLEAGKPADALQYYQAELDLVTASGLSAEVKENTRQGHHYNLARVAIARHDMANARSEAQAYQAAADARRNDGEQRAGHALAGEIALADRQYDQALAELAQASQQDMAVLYRTGLAHQGKGDKASAKALFARAADFNVLMGLNEALVRNQARTRAASL